MAFRATAVPFLSYEPASAFMSHLTAPKQEEQPYLNSFCKQYSTLNVLGQDEYKTSSKSLFKELPLLCSNLPLFE